MQAIFDFLASIGKMIEGIFTFIMQIILDIAYLVHSLDNIRDVIGTLFNWMPGVISATIVLILAIAIFYKVIGREG